MFRYLLLVQLFVLVASSSRFSWDDELVDLFEENMNDPNLNPGFDLDAFRDAQLDLHNYYRSLHGAPPMTRNETLTNHAQEFAEILAANDTGLAHCNDKVGCNRFGAGENLAFASGGTSAEINATKAWYDEIWSYNFCFDASDSTPRRPGHAGEQIGHFTQVVWEESTQLGIGYARNVNRTSVYIVARYLKHGNVGGQYSDNVKVPNYILDTFQNNCDDTNGMLTDWMGPGSCTRTCGGGVRLQSKTCTNPKPSLNGATCVGETSQLFSQEWCNTHSCPAGSAHHRDSQCTSRGFSSGRHYNFGGASDCTLFCFVGGNLVSKAGNVDDGTHCNSGAGACVSGVCKAMPQYVPTTPATTTEPETTTTEPETTTTEPETTTTEPETTTTEPETTTTEPETTTTEPETTTTEPETTTTEPETTTTEPETTTTEPETTTTEPETTTIEPETTTTEPETTTTEPETTTTEPETTTTEPETTTTEPETTTTEPPTTEVETTTAQPETTTVQPTTNTPSPTPTRVVRGRFRGRIRPGRGRIFLRLPSGRYRVTLLKPRSFRVRFYHRVKLGGRTGRWHLIRCSRCRFTVNIRNGYQREFSVYVSSIYCRMRRLRRFCRRGRRVSVSYSYRRL